MIKRKKTRVVRVGGVRIGGGAPVSVQSMTKTDTRDVRGTVAQIKELERLGCDIIRVAVKDMEAAKAIRKIKSGIHIPLVADIHFDCRLAIESINSGADKIRLNPGNIKDKSGVRAVIKLAKKNKVPIRIGVNSGSIGSRSMTGAVLEYIKFFERSDFRDIIISLKASDVLSTIEAYRKMSEACDYPLHLGVTAAGSLDAGSIKSAVGIGTLLAEGIGDTIRVSLTGSPHDEVIAGRRILQSLGLKKAGIEVISCPTCGRCEVDLVKIVNEFENKVAKMYPSALIGTKGSRDDRHLTCKPIKVAVMGCVVNGPGEAEEADIGIAAGKKCGMLFKKGRMTRKISEKDFVRVLLHEMDKCVNTDS